MPIPEPTRRFRFYIKAIFPPWRSLVYLLWTAFCLLATVRDNFFSEEEQQQWATLKLLHKIPHLPWWAWAIGLLVIAIFFVLEASYREVRAREHAHGMDVGNHVIAIDAKDAEIDRLTTKPDIRGEVLGAFWQFCFDDSGTMRGSRYYVKVRLTNHNHASCTVDEYRLAVDEIGGGSIGQGRNGRPSPIGNLRHPTSAYHDEGTVTEVKNGVADTFTWIRPLDIPRHLPLDRGKKAEGWLVFDIWNYLPNSIDANQPAPEKTVSPWQQMVDVTVIDSLGGEHIINGFAVNVAPARFSVD
jgi:hypothetical protein